MLVARTVNREIEVFRWLLLLGLAAALATLLTARLAGAEERIAEPGPLPSDMPIMAAEIIPPQEAPAEFMTPEHASHLVSQLKTVIAYHEAHRTEEARDLWQQMKLPAPAAVWSELGIALTNIRMAELDHAQRALERAEQLDPANPMVYYYRGILNLEHAYVATEYFDAIGDEPMKLASYRPVAAPQIRQPKSIYELMAMQDLQQAIDLSGNLFMDETLLPSYLLPADNLPPTVGELLRAWNAENYVGQAHNMLGAMCLERGLLERAEDHMDQATDRGANVLHGYRELGVRYEAEERYDDATRAYAKAIQTEPGVLPTQRMLKNLGRSLRDLW